MDLSLEQRTDLLTVAVSPGPRWRTDRRLGLPDLSLAQKNLDCQKDRCLHPARQRGPRLRRSQMDLNLTHQYLQCWERRMGRQELQMDRQQASLWQDSARLERRQS